MNDLTPQSDSDERDDAFDRRLRRGLILAAEIALVVAIIGLLLATWLPALVGASVDCQVKLLLRFYSTDTASVIVNAHR